MVSLFNESIRYIIGIDVVSTRCYNSDTMKQEETVAMTIRLPKKLRNKAGKKAQEEGRSLNSHIVYLLGRDTSAEGQTKEPVREAVTA